MGVASYYNVERLRRKRREEVEMEKLLAAVLECDSECLRTFDKVGYDWC